MSHLECGRMARVLKTSTWWQPQTCQETLTRHDSARNNRLMEPRLSPESLFPCFSCPKKDGWARVPSSPRGWKEANRWRTWHNSAAVLNVGTFSGTLEASVRLSNWLCAARSINEGSSEVPHLVGRASRLAVERPYTKHEALQHA